MTFFYFLPLLLLVVLLLLLLLKLGSHTVIAAVDPAELPNLLYNICRGLGFEPEILRPQTGVLPV